jgi:hypothetical protein
MSSEFRVQWSDFSFGTNIQNHVRIVVKMAFEPLFLSLGVIRQRVQETVGDKDGVALKQQGNTYSRTLMG